MLYVCTVHQAKKMMKLIINIIIFLYRKMCGEKDNN